MGNSVFRAIKIALICLAIAAGIAIVMKTIPFIWWSGVLCLLTALYWSIASRDPWVSSKSLRKLAQNIANVESSRPSWVGSTTTASSVGTIYFAFALMMLYASQFDYSTGTNRGFLKVLVSVTGPLFVQMMLVSIGTALLFWSYETMKAIRRHVSPTGQIHDDGNR